MAQILRQSTAVTVRVGSFVDASDGVTPETSVTLAAADQAELLKAAGAATVDISGRTWAAVTGADGWYNLSLLATDVNTVGGVTVVIQDASVFLPVMACFQVVEEAVYDALFAASALGPAQAGDAMDLVTDAVDAAALATSALTEIETAADDALVGRDLDHLVNAGAAPTPTAGSIFSNLMGSTFAAGTDSLEAIRDRGDVAWLTASLGGLNDLSIADIQTAMTNQGYTSGRATNLDNLDAAVSTLATAASIAALNDLSQADVGSALTAQGYTFGRALLLDNLDAAISSIATAISGLNDPTAAAIADAVWDELNAGHTVAGSFGQEMTDLLAAIAGLNDLSSADVQAALTAQGYTAARALLLDNLDATISSIAAAISGLNDPTAAAVADAIWDELLAGHAIAGSAGEALSTAAAGGGGLTQQQVRDALKLAPTGGAPAADSIDDKLDDLETQVGGLNDISIADVQTAMTNQGYTTARAILLDNLDAAISSVATAVSGLNDPTAAAIADEVWNELTAGHAVAGSFGEEMTDLTAALAALNDLSSADVQAALTAQGYTAARALLLDNLDATVSSIATAISGLNDPTAAAIADAVWDELIADHLGVGSTGEALSTASSGGVSSQAIRDAMKLAPTAGAPAAGSIDEHLDTIEADTAAIEPLVTANLDTTVSSRATAASIAALNDLSQADVGAALTAQGYTFGRALLLDNLDAAISTVASAVAGLNDPTAADVADAVWNELTSGHAVPGSFGEELTDLTTAIAALNDLSSADVQAALTAQGYTAARALLLDNLDATISSIATAISGLNDPTVAAIADAVWDELLAGHAGLGSTGEALSAAASGGGSGLTAQQVRDAMKLAPTAGAAAVDSIDDKLDDLETQIGALNDLSSADVQAAMTAQGYTAARALLLDNLDAAISGVNTAIGALNDVSIADVQTALTNQGFTSARALLLDNLDAAISSLNDLSSADVQAALTAQGYTAARALLLDNLDAAISTVVTAIGNLNDLSSADVAAALQADTRILLVEKLLRNRFEISTATGIATLYDDDGTTPLLSAQTYDDAAGSTNYAGLNALHRRNRLS